MKSRLPRLLFVTLILAALSPVVRSHAAGVGTLARYRVKREGRAAEELVLVRSDAHVEHRFVARGVRELWLRDARGELEHLKLYEGARRGVHYTPGDLRTIGASPNWDTLSSLVSESERRALRTTGQRRWGGRSVQRMRGPLRGQPAELDWLKEQGLPAKLVLGRGRERVAFELVELTDCSPALCASEPAADYRLIEFADLGDMEYDPFVRRFLAELGAHDHAHP